MRVILLCLSCLWIAACVGEQRPIIVLGDTRFLVELADTDEEIQVGLMFRDSLPADQGMLFMFNDESPRAFWMKNTRIPLDIVYFDSERRLLNVADAVPCRADPCPIYPSDGPARYVLELNAGTAARLGLKAGDRFELKR